MEKSEQESRKLELHEIKEKYIEVFSSFIKLVAIVSLPIGFIYLLSYTSANGISLPLSLSELPTLLLSMFGLGSALAILFLGFVFLPASGKLGLLGDKNTSIFEIEGGGNVIKYIFTIGFPLFLLLFSFLANPLKLFNEWYWYVLISFIVIGSFVYGIRSCYSKERLKVAGMILYFLFICFYWIFLGLFLFIKLLADLFPTISNGWFSVAIFFSTLAMLFVLFFMIVPWENKKPIPRAFWYGVGVVVILLPPLINPVAVKLAGTSLKIMKIGGGYQTIYVLGEIYRDNLPCQLINLEYPDRTVPLFVVLDIGKRIFVKLNDKNDSIVYALPSEAVSAQVYWKGNLNRDMSP